MTAVDVEDDPVVWDRAVLGGHGTPGHITVSGGAASYNWDAKAGTGKSGATTVFTGDDLTEITVRLEFADGIRGLSAKEQRREWFDVIVPILQRSADGKTAIEFYHPAVSEPPINLTAVVTKKIGQLQIEENGLTWVEFTLLKYVKPKPKPAGKPAGAKANAYGPPTAQEQHDAEIEKLTGYVNEAAAGTRRELPDDLLPF
ncbi:MAG: hypothetical protein R3B07_32140 [Polyangiaceae bacterium]